MNRLRVHHQVQDGCSVLHPRGRLDTSTYPVLRDALLEYAAEQPVALVVELDGLRADTAATLHAARLPAREHDMVAHALNEFFVERGGDHLVAYSGEPDRDP